MKRKDGLLKDFDEGKHGQAHLEVMVDIRDILLRLLATARAYEGKYEYPLYSEETSPDDTQGY